MMPQFASLRNKILNWENIAHGLLLFSFGLFKKVVIADTFAGWANPGFAANYLSMVEAWSTALSYTFQLYFDFSGYTDMALGIALLFNIRLPQNFNSPYKADSLIDFWRRWHMTLSRFLRDYIYIPLGGNRKGKIRRYINLLVTMLLGGLWHGAAWTFVLWGVLHGVGLAVNHLWCSLGFKMHCIAGRIITFLFVVTAWVFFRAENFGQALIVLRGMFNFHYVGIWVTQPTQLLPWGRNGPIVLFLTFLFLVISRNSMEWEWEREFKLNNKWALLVSVLLVSSLLGLNHISQFLYFQF
jgi:D-alanyl-lipoteichoic acid acyltransferase DltB (MBOAT superfamily)